MLLPGVAVLRSASLPLVCQVEEGSAKPGRDFTHSTAGLVQFDPGGADFTVTLTAVQIHVPECTAVETAHQPVLPYG